MLINELIREYLEFNNYHHSLSVFIPETGQPQQPPFDRNFIAKKLKIIEDKNTRDLPLLYVRKSYSINHPLNYLFIGRASSSE